MQTYEMLCILYADIDASYSMEINLKKKSLNKDGIDLLISHPLILLGKCLHHSIHIHEGKQIYTM